MFNKDDLEILEEYIRKTLSYEDAKNVENRLNVDEKFFETYRFLLAFLAGAKAVRTKNLLNELAEYESTLNEKNFKRSRRFIILALVALLASAIIATVYISTQKNKTISNKIIYPKKDTILKNKNNDSISQKRMQPIEINKDQIKSIPEQLKQFIDFPSRPQFADNTYRSDNANTDTNYLEKAILSFNKGQYNRCLEFIGNNNQNIDKYLKAHCFYNLKNFDKASQLFSSCTADLYFTYQEDATWYLAQSYINQYPQKFLSAKSILLKIKSDPEHQYNKDATILLENIKSIKN